ncbi:hypothetical protein [Enterococcus casseliflavus]|uniref:hypothetical protein n=1 Tax=Enterococcus casseliflavus TaxID=37734 RepID=UPI002890BA56|nr:hypothetical protein [Enterococcus casseliflavus]MDT2991020.1 hypothetical protein [Enterococcus casseliflavus]
MDYQQMNEQIKDQLTRYGKIFETDTEIFEVQDFVEGKSKGASYHSYLTEQLNAHKEAKQTEVNELQARFYQQQIESVEQQQEQLTKPEYQITRDEVLNLTPEEAIRLRKKIGASAYQSIMDGTPSPIESLLEEQQESVTSFEQYRGAALTDILPSVAVLIKRHDPEIYSSLT